MGYLLIKHIDKTKLQIKETNYSFKLCYNLPYLQLNKLLLPVTGYTISELTNKYIISLMNKKELHDIQIIDNYIKQKLPCKPILSDNTITLLKNKYVNDKLQSLSKKPLYITLFTIKKNAYQLSPIVYIL